MVLDKHFVWSNDFSILLEYTLLGCWHRWHGSIIWDFKCSSQETSLGGQGRERMVKRWLCQYSRQKPSSKSQAFKYCCEDQIQSSVIKPCRFTKFKKMEEIVIRHRGPSEITGQKLYLRLMLCRNRE